MQSLYGKMETIFFAKEIQFWVWPTSSSDIGVFPPHLCRRQFRSRVLDFLRRLPKQLQTLRPVALPLSLLHLLPFHLPQECCWKKGFSKNSIGPTQTHGCSRAFTKSYTNNRTPTWREGLHRVHAWTNGTTSLNKLNRVLTMDAFLLLFSLYSLSYYKL